MMMTGNSWAYLDSNEVLDVLNVVISMSHLARARSETYLDIVTGLLGQVVPGPRVRRGLLPSRHLVPHDLALLLDIKVRRVRVELL